MRVKLIKPCPKFAYPAGFEFDLDDKRAGHWVELGYMVAMGASPMKLPEKDTEQGQNVENNVTKSGYNLTTYDTKSGHNLTNKQRRNRR